MHAESESAQQTAVSIFEAGDLTIDLGRQRVTRAGQEIPLPKLSFDLLLALVRAAPNIATLDALMHEVWPTVVVGPETLSQRVKLLRDALQDDSREPRYIETLRSRGYRFMQPVVRHAPQAEQAPPHGVTSPATSPWSRRRIAVTCAALLAMAAGALIAYLPEKESTDPDRSSWTQSLPANTVAVLPFRDASTEPGGEVIAFGIAEGLLHRLSSVRNLTLIARASSFAAAEPSKDAREIGRRLNARYLIEGSVQRAGERLRITAQLIDARTAEHVWSLRFDRRVEDVFAMEDEITQSVAQALQLTLTETQHPYARFGTDAYLAFLHGRALLTTRKTADADAAIKQFERTIEMAPDFAMAYVGLADAYINRASLLALYPSEPLEDAMRRAGPLAAKAVELDDRLGEAYVLRGVIKSATGDTTAEADFRKGLELAPSYGQGFEQYSEFLQSDWRRFDEALVAIDRARAVDPLRPRNHYVKGRMLAGKGAFREAEELYLQSLEIAPDYYPALLRMGEIRWEHGQLAAAIKLGERAVAIEPQMSWMRPILADFYLDSGDEDAARALLADQTEPLLWLSVCMFNGRADRVASIILGVDADLERFDFTEEELVPYAIRDAALAAHHPAQASEALQERLHAVHLNAEGVYRWGTMLALAQVQKTLGQRDEAETLARSLLDGSVANLPHRIVYAKPAAYALLEQPGAALAALTENVNRGYVRRWWYTLEREPALRNRLGNDPRFLALLARVRQHASEQRALLDGMRERGEIPARKTNGKSATGPC